MALKSAVNGIHEPEALKVSIWNGNSPFQLGLVAVRAQLQLETIRPRFYVLEPEPTGAVSYRRKVASCSVDGADIGEWMVRQGWALAYRHFSKKYVPAEEEAQRERRGIWRGRFMKPWEWRKAKRLQ